MANDHRRFKTVICEELGRELAPLGFTKQGSTFWKLDEDDYFVVEVQSNPKMLMLDGVYTVILNLHIHCRRWCDRVGLDWRPHKASTAVSTTFFGVDGQPQWWPVADEAAARFIGLEFARYFRERGPAFFEVERAGLHEREAERSH